MWQEWNSSFIKEWWKATLKFYLRDTYQNYILFQTFRVAWTFKKISLLFGTYSHHRFYTPWLQFGTLRLLNGKSFLMYFSARLYFSHSVHPSSQPSICMSVYLSARVHTSRFSFVCMFTYIHTHIHKQGDLTLWISCIQNFVEMSIGYGISRKNT
jgi:hypothetical protein